MIINECISFKNGLCVEIHKYGIVNEEYGNLKKYTLKMKKFKNKFLVIISKILFK